VDHSLGDAIGGRPFFENTLGDEILDFFLKQPVNVIIHELQPGAVRVGVLVDPNYPVTASFISDVQAAASSIRKQIEVLEAPTGDIDMAFASLAQKPIDAATIQVALPQAQQRQT
jgi:hypothetical protein